MSGLYIRPSAFARIGGPYSRATYPPFREALLAPVLLRFARRVLLLRQSGERPERFSRRVHVKTPTARGRVSTLARRVAVFRPRTTHNEQAAPAIRLWRGRRGVSASKAQICDGHHSGRNPRLLTNLMAIIARLRRGWRKVGRTAALKLSGGSRFLLQIAHRRSP